MIFVLGCIGWVILLLTRFELLLLCLCLVLLGRHGVFFLGAGDDGAEINMDINFLRVLLRFEVVV